MNLVQSSKDTILLVDGMALMFRAFYASAATGYIRRTKAGVPTNAVYGFMRYFWDAVQRFGPTHIACCWDLGSKTFRTEQFSDYKGNRSDAPDELIPQFSMIREVMDSLGIPNVSSPGFEADDCIGTLSSRFGQEMDVLVLTGDHDMLQLVSERTSVIIMKKGHGNYMVYTPEALMEEKQLTPGQIVDLKGLMGDTSDNYPGVRGIGEKTALKLVQEHGSVEGILANLDQLSKSVRAKIEADLDMLHLSRQLATIRCDIELECDVETCRLELNPAQVVSKFEELEMASVSTWMGVV
ncbi:MAG: 5'-3' exonuclease H3TH domain-containing protein [Paenibacillus sp.]|uniref:5'-3' exonuclease n=1 Tax=Paenibacillus sp. TaxID=58172 RepID=UPI00290D4557|nr:5'-3' exonuclease H3TH domain-containing protein [Paenibacillus sp.]MDU4697916.1 5'-3' exonuclease H3TH domain-containing protein [Paenibacillus sp.]